MLPVTPRGSVFNAGFSLRQSNRILAPKAPPGNPEKAPVVPARYICRMPTDLRYPIGRFAHPASSTAAEREARIANIAALPERLGAAVLGLSDEQLDTPYRPDGWTARQVTHHVADSHVNAYCRIKLGLTEENPLIRPYAEDRWAMLADSRMPVDVSLRLLAALHERWVMLLRATPSADFNRPLTHPEGNVAFTVDALVAMYDWHGRHHTAHVTELRKREGW